MVRFLMVRMAVFVLKICTGMETHARLMVALVDKSTAKQHLNVNANLVIILMVLYVYYVLMDKNGNKGQKPANVL